MMDELLRRPESWFGLPGASKNMELSKLQMNLDEVTKSLITYSEQEVHNYQNPHLIVEIRRETFASSNAFESDAGEMVVFTKYDNDANSISFYHLANFACIVDGKYNW